MVKIIHFLKKNSPCQISYVGMRKISTASHQSPPITNISTPTIAPRRKVTKEHAARYLRPLQVVAEAFINGDKDYTLEDRIAVERKVVMWKGKPIKSYFFWSPSLLGLVSCAEKWVTVLEQGEHCLIWDEPAGSAPSVLTPPATNEAGKEIADFVSKHKISRRHCPRLGHGIQGGR
jgi:hypothetical protein